MNLSFLGHFASKLTEITFLFGTNNQPILALKVSNKAMIFLRSFHFTELDFRERWAAENLGLISFMNYLGFIIFVHLVEVRTVL